MLVDTLNQKIQEAMKSGDAVKLSTLKLLFSELHNYQIDHPQMTKEEELVVIKKEAKKRKDAIESYKKAGANDRAAQEEAELKILEEYLPEQMSDEELRKIIDQVFTEVSPEGIKDMGKVIGLVMAKAKGNADGGKVAQLVKAKLV